MKKGKRRVHHHTANKVRQSLAEKQPHASEAERSAHNVATEKQDEARPAAIIRPPLQSGLAADGGSDGVGHKSDAHPNPYEQEQLQLARSLKRATTATAVATVIYMAFSGYQSWQVKRSVEATREIIGQNERMIKATETQANAAQTTAAITTQLIVGAAPPKLLTLAPNEPMVVDFSFSNDSNFVASVTGWIVNFRFIKVEKLTIIPADGWIGGVDMQPFDLAPHWSGSIGTARSRPLSQNEVSAIKEGKYRAYVFFRVFVKGAAKPLDGCYTYDREDKSLTNCVITNPN